MRLGDDQLARSDQALLIGDSDGLARFDGFVGGLQSGYSNNRADDEIGVGMSGDFHRSG